VREFPQAERFLRAGKWKDGAYPLTRATMRDRTVGMVGMGRIGKAIARRLDAMGVPVVYHSRNPQPGVAYRHYPKLIDLARDVDTLMVIVPGGAETQNMIDAAVLEALGPNGILVNMARGSVVDEPALIKALQDRTIHRDGQRGAVPASRLGQPAYARRDGPNGGRQHPVVDGRQGTAHAGGGDAVAAAGQGLTMRRAVRSAVAAALALGRSRLPPDRAA
jgi:hypothetical protein